MTWTLPRSVTSLVDSILASDHNDARTSLQHLGGTNGDIKTGGYDVLESIRASRLVLPSGADSTSWGGATTILPGDYTSQTTTLPSGVSYGFRSSLDLRNSGNAIGPISMCQYGPSMVAIVSKLVNYRELLLVDISDPMASTGTPSARIVQRVSLGNTMTPVKVVAHGRSLYVIGDASGYGILYRVDPIGLGTENGGVAIASTTVINDAPYDAVVRGNYLYILHAASIDCWKIDADDTPAYVGAGSVATGATNGGGGLWFSDGGHLWMVQGTQSIYCYDVVLGQSLALKATATTTGSNQWAIEASGQRINTLATSIGDANTGSLQTRTYRWSSAGAYTEVSFGVAYQNGLTSQAQAWGAGAMATAGNLIAAVYLNTTPNQTGVALFQSHYSPGQAGSYAQWPIPDRASGGTAAACLVVGRYVLWIDYTLNTLRAVEIASSIGATAATIQSLAAGRLTVRSGAVIGDDATVSGMLRAGGGLMVRGGVAIEGILRHQSLGTVAGSGADFINNATNASASGTRYGIRAYSSAVWTGGTSIALYAQAGGGTTNYAASLVGDVLIGAASSSMLVARRATSSSSGYIAAYGYGSGTKNGYEWGYWDGTTSTVTWRMSTDGGNSNRLSIQDSGGTTDRLYVSQGGTAWLSVSDARLKVIDAPISGALRDIITLSTVRFRYRDDPEETRRIGLLAQEVAAILPEAVDSSDPERLGLSYTDLIPLIIAAIKELAQGADRILPPR